MNKSSKYNLTIIVPLYNEQDNISRLAKELGDYISRSKLSPASVLFVDDGSTDKSLSEIKRVCDANPDFYYLALEHNGGLSAALKAGFANTFSQYVGYIDADLQTTPEDFDLLADRIESYQLVTGIRADRKDSLVKNMSSRVANSFRRAMTKDGITDTGCPLKLMQTAYAKELPLFKGMHRFIPALIQMQGGRVCEVPVRHFPRQAGESKYTLRNRLVAPFVDCFAFRWMKKRYTPTVISDHNL